MISEDQHPLKKYVFCLTFTFVHIVSELHKKTETRGCIVKLLHEKTEITENVILLKVGLDPVEMDQQTMHVDLTSVSPTKS